MVKSDFRFTPDNGRAATAAPCRIGEKSLEWPMLWSPLTEEYDHVGTSECYSFASQAFALEQGQVDRGKAAAVTKTRLVDPDEASD